MKTPMKMMIQNIIDIESKTYNQEQLYMLSALKVCALVLLEKEKEQIVEAFEFGVGDAYKYNEDGLEYYNEKYQNK